MSATRLLAIRARALLLGLIAFALLIVPAGWMPRAEAEGWTRITLCSGHGRVVAWLDVEGGLHERAPADADEANDCPFAGQAVRAPAFGQPVIEAPLPDGTKSPSERRSPTPGRGLAAPPPFATGPPAAF